MKCKTTFSNTVKSWRWRTPYKQRRKRGKIKEVVMNELHLEKSLMMSAYRLDDYLTYFSSVLGKKWGGKICSIIVEFTKKCKITEIYDPIGLWIWDQNWVFINAVEAFRLVKFKAFDKIEYELCFANSMAKSCHQVPHSMRCTIDSFMLTMWSKSKETPGFVKR